MLLYIVHCETVLMIAVFKNTFAILWYSSDFIKYFNHCNQPKFPNTHTQLDEMRRLDIEQIGATRWLGGSNPSNQTRPQVWNVLSIVPLNIEFPRPDTEDK